MINFNDLDDIRSNGFVGFQEFGDLYDSWSILPDEKGVYLVLRLESVPVGFISKGAGGYFKGKDPNVSFEELKSNWVDGTKVVYIGKATSLKKRIRQYIKFGQGKNVGHWGGRLVWQIKDAKDLVLCWLETKEYDPRNIEANLIAMFKEQYGRRPFANLQD